MATRILAAAEDCEMSGCMGVGLGGVVVSLESLQQCSRLQLFKEGNIISSIEIFIY